VIPIYVACLLFGGILLGTSLVLGGKDTEAFAHGHDVPADGDAGDRDHPGHSDADHAPAWLTLLSMRFWTYTIGSFGTIGLVLSLFDILPLLGAAVASVSALAIGATIASLFRWFAREQVTAEVGVGHLVGQEARVMIPIRPGGTGKISIQTLAGREELPATSRDGKTLDPGQMVLVAHIEAGVADVTALPPGPSHGARPKVAT
jgi:hypothetical protein